MTSEDRAKASPGPGARQLALEGLLQSLAQGLGESYLSAFAWSLGAGGPVLGLVSSLPTAATALAQSLARRLHATTAATRAVVARGWLVQAVAYAGLGLCALLPYGPAVTLLCLVIAVGWGAAGLVVPAWTNIVAGVVPRAQYGRFFAWRGTAQQCGVVAAILGGGLLLGVARGRGVEPLGFVVLFLVAGLARAFGTALLAGIPETARPAPRGRTGGFEALRGSRRFRRLAIYLWCLHFATHVATPFFVPYMLAELRFSYPLIGALLAVPALVKIATVRGWGRVADRFGPGPLLRLAGWLVAPVPALWLVSSNPWWILSAQVISGLAWGAFDVSQASALLQTTRGRINAVSAFNLIDGGAVVLGSLLGGVCVHVALGYLGAGSAYLVAMAASALLRTAAAALVLHRVRKIGRADWPHANIPLRLWSIRPTRGFTLRPWSDTLTPESDEEDRVDGEEPGDR